MNLIVSEGIQILLKISFNIACGKANTLPLFFDAFLDFLKQKFIIIVDIIIYI